MELNDKDVVTETIEPTYWTSMDGKTIHLDNPAGTVDIHLSQDSTKLWITVDGKYVLCMSGMKPEKLVLIGLDKWSGRP